MASLVAFVWSLLFRNSNGDIRRTSGKKVPLPPVCHLVLNLEDVQDKALFVIGDVHGCLNELCELVEKAKILEKGREILFLFVGDLINKGPKNREVMEFVREVKGLAVRGNNDEAVIQELLKTRYNGICEVPNKYRWVTELDDVDLDYLLQMPYTISIPSVNAIIVHAGIIPGKCLEAQSTTDMILMRNIIEEDYFHGYGLKGDSHMDEGKAWASLWPGPEHVYFGHDARRGLQLYPHATGLDTGCVYGKQLSGVFLNYSRRYIFVQAHRQHKNPNCPT